MIKISLEFQSIEAAQSALAKLGGAAGAPVAAAPPVLAVPAYNTPLPVAASPAPVAAAPPAAPPPSFAPPPAPAAYAPPPSLGGVTLQNVIAAMQAHGKVVKGGATKAILTQFGATCASDVNPAYYPQLIEALRV